MANVFIPSYLSKKELPNNNGNLLALLKVKYGWNTYGDISEHELEKIYHQDFDKFWTVIKYLTFQGFEFSGKLNRYKFTSEIESGLYLYLHKQEQSTQLDYDYQYAFLKVQLLPNGIYDKYDLHLLSLDHILHKNLSLEKAKGFFEKEDFILIGKDLLNNNERLSVLIDDKSEVLSIDKKLVFFVGDSSYTVPKECESINLELDIIPTSKTLRVLIEQGYKTVNNLPKDLSFLLKTPQIGQRSIEKLLQQIENANVKSINKTDLKESKQTLEYNTILDNKSLLYLGEKFTIREKWMQLPIIKEKIDKNLYQLFNKYGFQTLGDLPTDIENFLRENGYGKSKSQELSLEVFNILPIQTLEELFTDTLKYFISKKKPAFLSERDWEIIYHKVSGDTLEQIGQVYGISREGIRQIVKKSFDKMFKPFQRYFKHITEKVKRNRFVNINSLFESVDAKVMGSIIPVYSLPFNVHNDYLFIGNHKKFLEEIDKFKTIIKNSRNETYRYSLAEIEQYVVDFLTDLGSKDQEIDIDQIQFLTNDLIKESFDYIDIENKYVFKQKLTKARMCQIVFEQEFRDGLHVYKEVDVFIEKLLQYYPKKFQNDSKRSILANLLRDEDVIVLWRVGYYKHISVVHPDVNATTLTPIKDWLQSQLNENNSQINTNAAFKQFSEELERLEVDTEHALFSLLKLYFPKSFNYSRSPNLVMVGHGRMEKKKIIENYVKSCDDYVTNETLTNHFICNLGWKQVMYEQNISVSENLIKTSDGLVHVDYLDIGKKELENIFVYIKSKINQLQNSFSIEIVFDERKSTLLQMNIRDSRVLYHLIEKYYPEEFDFYRYPHIHPVGKYEVNQLSVAGQFKTFFLEEDDYFNRDELHEEFIQERGWALSTYYMAFNKTKDTILEVFVDEFAHVDLIGWTIEKKEKLIRVLETYLTEKKEPFIHIVRDVISNSELIRKFPEINPMFDWNQHLLISILQNAENFILLGTKKAGILSKDNPFGIKNEQDYISYLLKNEFNGYVKVPDLQKYLYRIDMCGQSSIPQCYLTSEEKELDYTLLNNEVILNELVVGRQ